MVEQQQRHKKNVHDIMKNYYFLVREEFHSVSDFVLRKCEITKK